MSFREYEIRNKPLFASMKRAKVALLKSHPEPCSIGDFFDYLEQVYGEYTKDIDYVTFYDFVWKEDGIRYSIAYIYTTPNLYVRDVLFRGREKTTNATGWYPMVSGKRAYFTEIKTQGKRSYWELLKKKPPYVHLGKPISLKSVACDASSTALLLKCEKGSILLDTGFGVEKEVMDEISFIFLSHFHRDHSGGIFDVLKLREIPIILSDITLEYLINLRSIGPADKERLTNNAVLIERLTNNSLINRTLEFFKSYHCPGAYGLKYKYYKSTFVFPGDFCLTNGFYDFSEQFHTLINNVVGSVSILADCALIPRGDFAITDKGFSEIAEIIRGNDNMQIFLSRSPELLFNVYIRMFRMAVDEHQDWLFVVNDELFDLLQSSLRTWLLPMYKADPFVKYVLGKSGINYAETYRLFPMSCINQFSNYQQRRLMLLLSADDLGSVNSIFDLSKTDLYITGPLAASNRISTLTDNFMFNSIYMLSSPDWSFHSGKELLTLLLKTEAKGNRTFILFHAFSQDMKRFLREFPSDLQARIKPISRAEIQLF